MCPYVQRVAIVLLEMDIAFERNDIDLDDKPDWLAEISPNEQVPLLQVGPDQWLFESGVIARYLDTTSDGGLLPSDPLARAWQEAWMGYADGMLNIVARIIYDDANRADVNASMNELGQRLKLVCERFPPSVYFAGAEFGLVDAVFATLFRYFPTLDSVADVKLQAALPDILVRWWKRVNARRSVQDAVPRTYEQELRKFIAMKPSYAGRVLACG